MNSDSNCTNTPYRESSVIGRLLRSSLLVVLLGAGISHAEEHIRIQVTRLLDHPIITPESDPSIGPNIQGPSLIRVRDWVPDRLGRYYLYFADHKGAYIRLAYADELEGPWKIHVPGSLQLADSHFPVEPPAIPEGGAERVYERYRVAGMDPDKLPHDPIMEMSAPHIASPDVHVDNEQRRILMYFHGLEDFGVQISRLAWSTDGIHFTAEPRVLGRTYMRAFEHAGAT